MQTGRRGDDQPSKLCRTFKREIPLSLHLKVNLADVERTTGLLKIVIRGILYWKLSDKGQIFQTLQLGRGSNWCSDQKLYKRNARGFIRAGVFLLQVPVGQ